jgi:hypothetical protein
MTADPPAGRRIWPAFLFVAAAVVVAAALAAPTPVRCEDADIAVRRATQRTSFSDDEIKDGFFKIALHPELQLGKAGERIRKFDGPVRVFVAGRGEEARRAQIAAIVADIRTRVDRLDIGVTGDLHAANFTVTLVPGRDIGAAIGKRYGVNAAKKIETALKPQCLSGIGKDANFRIRRAEAILPADVDDFSFADCAYEELLQGLGLINDDSTVPWTMFNDEVQMGFFDVYDEYLANILYDPRVRAGMTREQVEALLPDILPKVRSFVAYRDVLKSAQ